MTSADSPSLAEIQTLFENKTLVEAFFQSRNSGGYVAKLFGHRAFMPGSHSLVPSSVSAEQDDLIGSSAAVIIIEIIAIPFQLKISRREARDVQEARDAAKKSALKDAEDTELAELAAKRKQEIKLVSIGDVLEATAVFNKTKYAFLQAGSLLIRVHKKELSWGEFDFPNPGTVLQCVVTAVNLELVALEGSIRLTTSDPWLTIGDRYQAAKVINIKVRNIAKYGVFAQIEPGVDCLVPRSQILTVSDDDDLNHYFSPGDNLPVVIESVDVENRRIYSRLLMELPQWAILREIQHQLNASETKLSESEQSKALLASQVAERTEQWILHEQATARYNLGQAEVHKHLINARQQSEQALNKAQTEIANMQLVVEHLTNKTNSITQSLKATQEENKTLQAIQNDLDDKVSKLNQENTISKAETRKLTEELRIQTIKAGTYEKQLAELINLKAQPSQSIPEPVVLIQPDIDSQKQKPFEQSSIPPPVFITLSNSKQLINNISLSEEFRDTDPIVTKFHNFNRLEKQRLLAFQQLCQFPERYLTNAANRVRKEDGKMLFGNTPPAFHRSPTCRFALSSYVNYEVPDEIIDAGKDKETEYREWWAQRMESNPNYRDNPILMDSLLTNCQLKFRLATKPHRITAPNGGIVSLTKVELADLEEQIARIIADAANYANSSDNHRILISRNGTHAYKGSDPKSSIDNPTTLTDYQARNILQGYENDYKKLLIGLMQSYYRSKYNDSLAFDHALLIAAGFHPCHGCFGADATNLMHSTIINLPPAAASSPSTLPTAVALAAPLTSRHRRPPEPPGRVRPPHFPQSE